jgi:hypothetical protein
VSARFDESRHSDAGGLDTVPMVIQRDERRVEVVRLGDGVRVHATSGSVYLDATEVALAATLLARIAAEGSP